MACRRRRRRRSRTAGSSRTTCWPARDADGQVRFSCWRRRLRPAASLPRPSTTDDPTCKKYAEAPRGRMDTRGWGLTLGRYRTTAMRSAAAQYTKLAKEYGLKGGPARRPTPRSGLTLDAIDATPSLIRARLTELSFRFVAGRKAVTSSLVGHTSLSQARRVHRRLPEGGEGPSPGPASVGHRPRPPPEPAPFVRERRGRQGRRNEGILHRRRVASIMAWWSRFASVLRALTSRGRIV